MRRFVIAVVLCLTISTVPVINPDNVQPSSWFVSTQTQAQKGK